MLLGLPLRQANHTKVNNASSEECSLAVVVHGTCQLGRAAVPKCCSDTGPGVAVKMFLRYD